jgi:3-methylfumaryl-CoA hydratase
VELAGLEAWVGRREVARDVVTPVPLRALAATLETGWPEPVPGIEAPPLADWLYFLPIVPASQIGPDGHPAKGGFLPPVPLERRMWAGSRLAFAAPLRVGEAIERRSEILKVTAKDGRSGPMVFVTVRHEVHGPHGLVVSHEQDIVYLPLPERWAPPPPTPLPEGLAWTETRRCDPVLLFRFSALTFNAHRIHFDRDYAREVEKYPGLVVHGPLQAMLLMAAATARNPGKRPAGFVFRGVRPLLDQDAVTLAARETGDDGLELFTANGEGAVAMQATLTWQRSA